MAVKKVLKRWLILFIKLLVENVKSSFRKMKLDFIFLYFDDLYSMKIKSSLGNEADDRT